MEIKTAEEIVEENFKGLDELIEDKDLVHFYKGVIKECMIGFAEQFISLAIEQADKNWWAGKKEMTMSELVKIENLIKQNI